MQNQIERRGLGQNGSGSQARNKQEYEGERMSNFVVTPMMHQHGNG